MEVAGHNFNQPYVYSSQVEYIEGTGTQWINTLVPVTDKIKLEVVASMSKQYDSSSYSVYGLIGDSNNGSRVQGICFGTDRVLFASKDNQFTDIVYAYANIKNIYVYDSVARKCRINDIERNLLGYGASGKTYGILYYPSRLIVNGDSGVSAKVYSCKISGENGILFDGIPVRVGDEGCLYDRVSDKLFINSGTGKFICGPDCGGEV